ncbi:enoyl-CoA hydratase-related protein [Sphingopyxis sp.]|uniref:enoyl-CoA hydratase-related protein n=1 Tax=Sphingopyxis sp. TaxID=1908224 RepID=UPI003D6D0E90
MSDSLVLIERIGRVGVATLNRPEAKNAFNQPLATALGAALGAFEADTEIGAIVLTGGDTIFSAGADIKEMTRNTFADAYLADFSARNSDIVPNCRKPVIAAVAGYALGGGCEVALACDMIIADETARFGQPEVKVGILPGGGGTQRLTRLIGKGRTMELCLTGDMIDAQEAAQIGLVTRLVPAGQARSVAIETAGKIAGHSLPAVMMIKECINRAHELTLAEGVKFERRMLHTTFALEDQTEAMRAFAERRAPVFNHR